MAFESVNSKVVRAQISQQGAVLARRGAMLGYDGNVSFRPLAHAPGAGMITGESNKMMASEGSGSVLYGYRGLYVTVIVLTGDSLSVEADRILAHDASLQTSVEMIAQGGVRSAVRGAMTGQGLFTTRISGHGSVAVLSHGGTFPLQLSGQTVGVDPQAYVGHSGALQVDLKSSVGMRHLVGRGSGEAFQLHVSGHGTVYVQASEEKF
ncbi:AIM24 family protein [Cellulomonas rhizosphaerae]|uniref:AIM24 family protein n=1 Tax=Cellulomonas rhizosphaerae TaxID=2293719 RepID=A0A413RQS3_9CELL|nr:AIM24 family protein [Cellulomonas rhizosphaerae]RHA44346.1 AIM24 family protein [Cellulomonas rhizosphaerae]